MITPKLLFYINAIYGGGAERAISNLASVFSAHGYQVVLVTSFYGDKEYVLETNVKRLSLEESEIRQSFLKRNISRILKLRNICKKEKPDVLISFMGESNFRALLTTRGLPIKNIISVRSDPNFEYAGYIGKFLGRHLLPIADGCVFQTEDAQKWFPPKLQEKSKIIFNPVKEEFYQTQYHPVPGRIVSCGRLEEPKNFRMLIDVFAGLSGKYSTAELLIYGEGSLKRNLQEQIKKLGKEEKIFLMGATDDIPKVLSNASIFVLSSMSEGMPNALMEAMAVGVPCVSTDCPCGGPRMLIDSGENGILVENNNPFALAEAMEALLSDSTRAFALGMRAKESALEYHQERIFRLWEGYINKILQR